AWGELLDGRTLSENIVPFGIHPGRSSDNLKISNVIGCFQNSFQRAVRNSEAAAGNKFKRRSAKVARFAWFDGCSFKHWRRRRRWSIGGLGLKQQFCSESRRSQYASCEG